MTVVLTGNNRTISKLTLGKPEAPIMVICDSPPPRAWRQGRVMPLEYMQTFSKCAKDHGFSREDFYFVVPSPPIPEDNLDSEKLKHEFVGQFYEEFAALLERSSAKCIVYLGNTAGRQLTGRPVKITKVRGMPSPFEDTVVLPMLSLGQIIRSPENYPLFDTDMGTLRRLFDSGFQIEDVTTDEDSVDYEYTFDLSELIEARPKIIAVDTETTGLEWQADHVYPFLCQISYKEGQSFLVPLCERYAERCGLDPADLPRAYAQLKEILEDPNIHKTGHLLKYDIHMLRKIDINVKGWRHDTIQLAYCVDENMRTYSLDDCVRRWVPEMAGYSDGLSLNYDKSRMLDVPIDVMRFYSGGDTDAALRLFKVLYKEARKDKRHYRRYTHVAMPTLTLFSEVMEKAGLRIDRTQLQHLRKELKKEIGIMEDELLRTAPAAIKRRALEGGYCEITKQKFVREVLFDERGFAFEPVVFTKAAKEPSLSAKDHLVYFEDHDWVHLYIEYVKIKKLNSTYVSKYDRFIYGDKIHATFSLHKTNTGRVAASDPNVQNLPSRGELAKTYKRMFLPKPGFKLIAADFSQAELRVIAQMSGDREMKGAYLNNIDLHAKTAASTLGLSVEDFYNLPVEQIKQGRQSAKAINFGLCLHSSTKVLTLVGYKRITDVLPDDLLWDGHEWVSHGGVVYKGKRKVIDYDGIKATPDHEVFVTDTRKIPISEAAESRARILRIGEGGTRLPPNWLGVSAGERIERQAQEQDTYLQVHTLRGGKAAFSVRHTAAQEGFLQLPWTRKGEVPPSSEDVRSPLRFYCSEVREEDSRILEKLQGAWDKMPIQFEEAVCRLGDCRISGYRFQAYGLRQDRQRRTLLPREYETCAKAGESPEPQRHHKGGVEWGDDVPSGMGRAVLSVCGTGDLHASSQRTNHRPNNTEGDRYRGESLWQMEDGMAFFARKAPKSCEDDKAEESSKLEDVYDIMNAGPRRRFVANGRIVSNCYGMSAGGFRTYSKTQYKVEYTEAEAERIHGVYFSTYKNLSPWHNRQIKFAEKNGYIESLHGVKRRLPSIYSPDRAMQSQAKRQAINAPVQLFASDLNSMAAFRFMRDVPQEVCQVILMVHDSIILQVREDLAEEFAAYIKFYMENQPLGAWFGFEMEVPLAADIGIGTNYADTQEIEGIQAIRPSFYNLERDSENPMLYLSR